MYIRTAETEDLKAVADLEALCFPPAEAADAAQFEKRLHYYKDHFWLLFDEDDKLISFVDGFVTDEADLTDEMYEQAEMHSENGAWQMIFGVNTHPDYRRRGIATKVLKEVIGAAKEQGRKGLVLTCKELLIPLYAGVGFVDEGVSGSTHGGVVWHQMRCII